MLSPEEQKGARWENPCCCQECGGQCCQNDGCIASPDDFDGDVSIMRNAIQSGDYSIDLFRDGYSSFDINGNEVSLYIDKALANPKETFFIRARNVNRPIVDIYHDSGNGPCIMWQPGKGCKLSYEQRPKFGRTLLPSIVRTLVPCMDYYTVYKDGMEAQVLQEWKPFSEAIAKWVVELFDPNYFEKEGIRLRIL